MNKTCVSSIRFIGFYYKLLLSCSSPTVVVHSTYLVLRAPSVFKYNIAIHVYAYTQMQLCNVEKPKVLRAQYM